MIKNVGHALNPPYYIPDRHPLEYLSSNGCMSLQKTNVRMSGNIKHVWKSDSELFIESISSDDYFSSAAFKKFAVDLNQPYNHNVYTFLKEVAHRESIWHIKDIEATKAENFSDQYEYIYTWGAYTETNDLIGKRFRFFAPLFTYGKLPDRFIILRVKNAISDEESLSLRDYIANSELVLSVDMKSSTTRFGQYLHTLTDSTGFKEHALFANFKESFIKYHGLDINSGKHKYVTESNYDSLLANERTITEYNNVITNGWMRSELLCTNILNLEFAFDDPTAPEGFNTYIGFYCYDNEVSKDLADVIIKEPGTLVINSTDKASQLYQAGTKPLDEYTSVITTTTTTTTEKNLLPPIAELKLPYMPVPGSVLTIKYLNSTELSVYMLGDILECSTTDEVLQLIANQINTAITPNIVVTAHVSDSTLIIRSQVTDKEYENIIVDVPAVFTRMKPKFYDDDAMLDEDEEPISDELLYDTMRMISYRDLFITTQDIPLDTDTIEIDGTDYKLEQTFRYLSSTVIRLNDEFETVRRLSSNIIKFKKTSQSSFNILSFVKHVNFDMSMKESPYYDIYDFDIAEYQKAYAESIKSILEKSVSELTTQEAELISAYREFFQFPEDAELIKDGIPVINTELEKLTPEKEVLISSLDSVSRLPNKLSKNEYERLAELDQPTIQNANLLLPQIAKFANIHGTDGYSNPIMLNSSLPWGQTNFINPGVLSISPEHGSHQWFLLGSGPSPYKDGKFVPYLNSLSKQLGYANVPADGPYHSLTLNSIQSKFDFTSTDVDVYDLLEYRVHQSQKESKTYFRKEAYTRMFRLDGEVSRYNAIFRGVEWSFIGEYEDYRFSVVMVTCTNTDNQHTFSSPYNLVDNKVFKTLTLVIINYIPDNLLTTGAGTLPYYLDRSFFYNSSKAFGTSKSIDIADISQTSKITLELFKSDWFRKTDAGEYEFFIGYPDSNTRPLKEVLGVEKNFEWMHIGLITSDDTISIFSRYTAIGITDITDTGFWCSDIAMEFAPNPQYLTGLNSFGYQTHTFQSLQQMLRSTDGYVTVGSTRYRIPYWEKIKESHPIHSLINADNTERYGITLKDDFTEDKEFLNHDQLWIAARNIVESGEMIYLVNTGTREINNQTTAVGYVKDILDSYPISTFIISKDDYITTTKSAFMLMPDDTFIIISLGCENSELYRLSERMSLPIKRQTGFYSPLFRKILQPESITIAPEVIVVSTRAKFDEFPKYRRRVGQLVYFSEDSSSDTNMSGFFKLEEDLTTLTNVSTDYPVFRIQNFDEFTEIPNRYVGQFFWVISESALYSLRGGVGLFNLVKENSEDIELFDCVIPSKPISGWVGRKICTSTDNVPNYCEQFIDDYMTNPTTSQKMYSAQYDDVKHDVITAACLSEHRGLLSNTYYNGTRIDCKTSFSKKLNLVDITRWTVAPAILLRYLNKDAVTIGYETCINALKLYNIDVNSDNVIYESIYVRFYERFYIEWFSKHYKVTKVTTDTGYSIPFNYDDIQTISLKDEETHDGISSSVKIKSVTITFEKI